MALHSLGKIYNLPGRVTAEFQYLFPRPGQALASAHRRDSPVAHFILSSAIYFVVGVFIYSYFYGKNGRFTGSDRPSANVSRSFGQNDAYQTVPPDNQRDAIKNGQAISSKGPEATTPINGGPGHPDEAATVSDEMPLEARPAVAELSAEADELILSPGDDPVIKNAAKSAASSMQRQPWSSAGLSGYVIPSKNPGTRCISAKVVIERPKGTYQPYDPIIICSFDRQ